MLVQFVRRFSKMSLPTKIKPLLFLWCHLLICTFLFTSLPLAMGTASDDYTSLVFKGCSKQMFPNNVYPENLKPLMDSLVSNSSLETFLAATATSGDGTNGINGLYQCRGDLSPAECNTCIRKIPPLVSQLCGETNVAVRVQLRGCYLRYEIADSKPFDATEFLFKRCEVNQARAAGLGEKRDTAFGILENDVKNSSTGGVGGFYTGGYDTVNVSGQCEGTLVNQDCVACLQSASQKAKTECGDSVTGQIYLYKCSISYKSTNSSNANANGVPYSRKVGAGSGNHPAEMVVAILAGCILGLILLGAVVIYIIKECRS